MDLADNLAAQARTLFGHLPDGEVGDDEPLHFRTDADGNLAVALADRHVGYVLRDGVTWRYRVVPGGEEVTTWRDGQRTSSVLVPSGRPEAN